MVVAGAKTNSAKRAGSICTEIEWEKFCSREATAHTLFSDRTECPTSEPILKAYTNTLIADSTSFARLDSSLVVHSYSTFIAPMPDDDIGDEKSALQGEPFGIRVVNGTGNRRFCVIHQGFFAMIPGKAEVEDLICILLGGETPMVLRRDESDRRFILIGDYYVHSIMKGEALERDDFHVEQILRK